MRTLRVAAVVAAVGIALVAVGCGPDAAPSTPRDTAKMKEQHQQPQPSATEATQKGDDLAAKVKALEAEVNGELAPFEKAAFDELKDKIKATDDANKKGALLKVQTEATTVISDVKMQLKNLSAVKDQAGFDDAKKKLKEGLDKVKAVLKDHM